MIGGARSSLREELSAIDEGALAPALLAVLSLAAPKAWAEWEAGQNSSDPFCNEPGSPGSAATPFTVWGEPTAEVQLEIWDSDATGCLIGHELGQVGPGAYYLMWHGTDGMHVVLPDGGYPYRLRAALNLAMRVHPRDGDFRFHSVTEARRLFSGSGWRMERCERLNWWALGLIARSYV